MQQIRKRQKMSVLLVWAIALAGLATRCVGDRVEIMLLQLTATTPNEKLSGRDPSCTYTINLSLPNSPPITACKTNQDLSSGTALYNLQIYLNEEVAIMRTALLTATVALDCSEQNCPENLGGEDCIFEDSCGGFADSMRQMTSGLVLAFSRNTPVDRIVSLANYNVSFRLSWTGPTDPPTLAPTPFPTVPTSVPTSSPTITATTTTAAAVATSATPSVAGESSPRSATDAANANNSAPADNTGTIVGIAIGASACILFVVVGAIVLALRSKRRADEIKAVAVKNTSYILDSAREPADIPDAPVVAPTLRTNDYAVSFATFSEDAVRDDGAYAAPLDRKPTVSEADASRDSTESSRYASARRPTGYAPATQLTQSLKPSF
jgi:hypothetical protein